MAVITNSRYFVNGEEFADQPSAQRYSDFLDMMAHINSLKQFSIELKDRDTVVKILEFYDFTPKTTT